MSAFLELSIRLRHTVGSGFASLRIELVSARLQLYNGFPVLHAPECHSLCLFQPFPAFGNPVCGMAYGEIQRGGRVGRDCGCIADSSVGLVLPFAADEAVAAPVRGLYVGDAFLSVGELRTEIGGGL